MAQGKKLNCKIESKGITHEITPKHPVYRLRYVVMTRCYNASKRDYPYYQSKGIKLCQEWLTNPESFFKWCFDNNWEIGLALDRKDSTKDYSPDNCQFISKSLNLKKMHHENNFIGENSPNAKLNKDDVIEIKKRLDLGVTCSRLSRDFNVSRTTIQAIKTGQNWSHLKK